MRACRISCVSVYSIWLVSAVDLAVRSQTIDAPNIFNFLIAYFGVRNKDAIFLQLQQMRLFLFLRKFVD